MNKKPPASVERTLLLRLIDQGYDRQAWHGPNLKSTIRRVSVQQAVWRPAPGRHSIAEIVVHCAYWKYAVRRRIRGDRRGSFPLKGSNWFAVSENLPEHQWRDFMALLDSEHVALREAIEMSPWTRIAAGPGGGAKQPADNIHGAVLHDIYHAGQIQTLKALQKTQK